MTDLLEFIVFESPFSWSLAAITLLVIVAVPRVFGLNFLTGLVFAQYTLFVNSLPVIAGLDSQAINLERGLHFFSIEFIFLLSCFAVYRSMLRHRVLVLRALRDIFDGKIALVVIASSIIIATFNYIQAPTDGSSRIAYMTEAWFSLVKPYIAFVVPLSYVGVFILLSSSHRKYLGYILLTTTVLGNIATGSKASFLFALVGAFLALRDLSKSDGFRISKGVLITVSLLAGASVIFALVRLDVSASDVFDRILLTSDATILTYFSDLPTAACANVSTFASMHRGWARLLGDASALDIDTLFGYALNIEKFGFNSFTGPNARLGAYVLCNFPGARFILGVFVVSAYLALLLVLFRRLLNRPTYTALVYPFLLTSLTGASQDFNLIMQDITMLVALLIVTISFFGIPTRRQLG